MSFAAQALADQAAILADTAGPAADILVAGSPVRGLWRALESEPGRAARVQAWLPVASVPAPAAQAIALASDPTETYLILHRRRQHLGGLWALTLARAHTATLTPRGGSAVAGLAAIDDQDPDREALEPGLAQVRRAARAMVPAALCAGLSLYGRLSVDSGPAAGDWGIVAVLARDDLVWTLAISQGDGLSATAAGAVSRAGGA